MSPAALASTPLGPKPGATPSARASAAYWLCQVIGWGVTALFAMASTSMAPAPVRLGAVVGVGVWAALTGFPLSHAWRRFLAQRGWLAPARRTPWVRMLGCVLALAIVQCAMVSVAFLVLRPVEPMKGWAWLPSAMLNWTFIFFVWTAIYATVSSLRGARRLQMEALQLQILTKDSELRALKAQVNPHFFFNSLNSLRALVYENPDAAARMIDQLAGAMRHALQPDGNDTVSLSCEIEAVKAYLAIEKIRFEERLRSHITVEAGLDEMAVPPMALQTLVENAVKYGVERRTMGSEIRITVRRDGAHVRVEVANQGEVASPSASLQLGIDNTRKRLQLLLGPAATLELATRDGWVVAALSLPGQL